MSHRKGSEGNSLQTVPVMKANKTKKTLRDGVLQARSFKRISWGETLDYVSCFSLHFFHALAASCVLYNRTEHSQGFSICQISLQNKK